MDNVIEIKPINTQEVEVVKKESEHALTAAKEMVIKDNLVYEWAGNYHRTIKGKISNQKAICKSMTKGIDETRKRITELFKEPLKFLEEAATLIEIAMLDYKEKQERIRVEQERKLQTEANKKREEAEKKAEEFRKKGKEAKAEQWEEKTQTIVAPTIASNVPKLDGIHYRDHWTVESIDLKILPDEYKITTVNTGALVKMAEKTNGVIEIPGVKFKCEKLVISRKINMPF